MADDQLTGEQLRELADRLGVRLLDDDIEVVASIYRTHDLERERMRSEVRLTDEPLHVFAPVAASKRSVEARQ